MYPNDVLTWFENEIKKSAPHLLEAVFGELLAKMRLQVQTGKYDAGKTSQMIANIASFWRKLLANTNCPQLLKQLDQEWPKSIENARLRLTPSTQLISNTNLSNSNISNSNISNTTISTTNVTNTNVSNTNVSNSNSTNALLTLVLPYLHVWAEIQVTDRPTGKHGRYDFTEEDKSKSQIARGAAGAQVYNFLKRSGRNVSMNTVTTAEYWLSLGRMVLKAKAGRCFSCAAAAVYSLVSDPNFDAWTIYVGGSSLYDHHFIALTLNGSVYYAIDIWQENLNGTTNYVHDWNSFVYAQAYTNIVTFSTTDRQSHRGFLQLLEQWNPDQND